VANSTKGISRRQFGRSAATAGALAAAPMIVPGSALGLQGETAPSDRFIVGGIGLGGRGQSDLQRFLNEPRVQFVGICDIREERREEVKSTVDQHYGNNDCEMFDFAGKILDRDDIEVLLIATSDRWHCCMASWAAQAGKDMYCEKPSAISIAECYALAEVMERYGTVFQAGTQRRNLPHFEYAIGLARSGKLGVLQEVHANTRDRDIIPVERHSWWPNDAEEPDPRVFSWDDWLGPTPWRPYNSTYMDIGRGQFWDWHGGILEWASHTVDLCQMAANMDDGNAIEHERIPGTANVESLYPNGVKLVMRTDGWLDSGSCAVRFIGSEGWVETGDNGVCFFSDNLEHLNTVVGPRGTDPTLHVKDFLDCVRSRSRTRANHIATSNAHITSHGAYIAAQLERKLYWDPDKREFINDDEANRMRSRAYREPWRNFALATNM